MNCILWCDICIVAWWTELWFCCYFNRGGDEALEEQLKNLKDQLRRKEEQLEQQSREMSSLRVKVSILTFISLVLPLFNRTLMFFKQNLHNIRETWRKLMHSNFLSINIGSFNKLPSQKIKIGQKIVFKQFCFLIDGKEYALIILKPISMHF